MPSMTTTPSSKSFCAAIPGAAAGAGGAPVDESVALAVAVFAFIGAAMWVFHRYGQRSEPVLELQPAGAQALAAAPS
jgi:hypothetical protein